MEVVNVSIYVTAKMRKNIEAHKEKEIAKYNNPKHREHLRTVPFEGWVADYLMKIAQEQED